AGTANAAVDAQRIAAHLANHNNFRSHARRVGMTELQGLGVRILDLRTQPTLHEALHDLYTALMITFANTGVYKLFENSRSSDDTLVLALNVVQQPQPAPVGPTAPAPRVPRLPAAGRPPRSRRH